MSAATVTKLYQPQYKAVTVATAAMDMLMKHFGSRFKAYRRSPLLQGQPMDLPMLGVFVLRERRREDGDANHAGPHFKSEITIGFSGSIHAETADQNKIYELKTWIDNVDDILLGYPPFIAMTEGIVSMDRQSQHAKVGETTLFEIRVEMTFVTSVWFEPRVEYYLERVHVKSQYQ